MVKKIKKPLGARKAATAKSASSTKESSTTASTTLERREANERRSSDRRKLSTKVAVDHRQVQRREKVSRRRQIDPTTCERDYTFDEVEFMSALDDYKRQSGRMFPTCSEILEVLRGLGYQKHQPLEIAVAPLEPNALSSKPAPSE